MGQLVMVTGGARSGKSTFSERLMESYGKGIAYVATALVTDEDMARRIEHHKASRPSHWKTLEGYKAIDALLEPEKDRLDGVLVECMSTLITNLMFEKNLDFDACSQGDIEALEEEIAREIDGLLAYLKKQTYTTVIVTNEVGLGLIAPYRLGNIFRDIAGRMNQKLAAHADQVYMIVSGIPMCLKGGKTL